MNNNIELEVNQVWGSQGRLVPLKVDIIKLTEKMVYYFFESGSSHGVRSDSQEEFTKHNTLITNADGTPYVAPVTKNDYQPGDVWVYKSGLTILIGNSDNYIRYDHGWDSIDNSALSLYPSDYTLLVRDGKVVKDA